MDKLMAVMEKKHISFRAAQASAGDGTFLSSLPAALFAIDAMARVSTSSVPGMTGFSSLTGILETSVVPVARYPLGLHTNPMPELCICLWGNAGMEIHDHRFHLKAGDIAYLHPGVVHSEGYIQAQQGYQLLWMSVTPDGFGFSAVTRSIDGWHFPFRTAARSLAGTTLHTQLTGLTPGTPEHFEQFRSIWLFALAAVTHAVATPEPEFSERDPVRQMMLEVKDHIDHHLSARLSLAYLARYSGFTGTHLNRLFRKQFGVSVHGYVIDARLKHAHELLKVPSAQIQQVARSVGYDDPLYFSKAFKAKFGRPPSRSA